MANLPPDQQKAKTKTKVNHEPEIPADFVRHDPEKNANIVSRICLLWITGLIWKGWRNPLRDRDMWELQEDEKSRTTTKQFAEAWQRRKETTYFRLVWALWDIHRAYVVSSGILRLLDVVLGQISPVFLNELLDFLNVATPATSPREGIAWAVGLFLTPLVKTFVENHYFLRTMRMGIRVRSALQGALYDKSLRMSPSARNASTVGEIVNLMQLDSQKINDFAQFLHVLWAAPLQIFISVALLYVYIGPSAFIGLALTLLTLPLQIKLITMQSKLREKNVIVTDERVKLMNEILQGIKAVKFYAWEKPFAGEIDKSRKKELSTLRTTIWVRSAFMSLMLTVPTIIAVVTFTFYVAVFGEELDPALIFTGIALLNQLRAPVIMLPFVFSSLIDARLGVKRINRFLELDDTSDYARQHEKDTTEESLSATGEESSYSSDSGTPESSSEQETNQPQTSSGEREKPSTTGRSYQQAFVDIKDGSFSWGMGEGISDGTASKGPKSGFFSKCLPKRLKGRRQNSRDGAEPGSSGLDATAGGTPNVPADAQQDVKRDPIVLRDITMSLEPGQLTAIIGHVGSGKSSLVHAILGEMKKEKGQVTLRGSVAYVAQNAWIFNDTLRNNILFGKKFDEKLYKRALKVSALEMDLAQLSAGDQTAIGEKGINLSGGQKQRVSIARAIYADADIYIFDDPLSALDAGVAQTVFEKCLSKNGVLRKRLRLLVTNQLQFLPECDNVVLLRNGYLRKQGKYNTLMATDPEFRVLMEESMADDKEKEDDHDVPQETVMTGASFSVMSRAEMSEIPKSTTFSIAGLPDMANQKGVEAGMTLMTDEEREMGNMTVRTYYDYAVACGGVILFILIIAFFCVAAAVQTLTIWWNSYWTEEVGRGTDRSLGFFVGIYWGLGLLYALMAFFRSVWYLSAALIAARDLHTEMFDSVMRAPMMFFDTTPIGRIISRFSRDVFGVDQLLPQAFLQMFSTLIDLLASYITIAVIFPWFIIVAIPVAVGYFGLQRFFNRTSLELKRLDSISKSPIYANFSETLGGLSTIRAYGKQKEFKLENLEKIDINQRAFFCFIASNRWFSLYLEMLGSLLIFAAAMFAVLDRGNVFAGLAGLSLVYALTVTAILGFTIRSITEVEGQMNSVERMTYYARQLPQEAPAVMDRKPDSGDGSSDPLAMWPKCGKVEIRNLSLRYRENLELVLKGMTVTFEHGEKVGIVGRTGAGKSSLMIALLRLVEPAGGSIIVDGVDISTIGLDLLRTKLTIIPQEPVLFSGTLRFNLDPFNDYTETEIWDALGKSQLKEFASSFDGQLDGQVSEYGQNLSAGQRQLVCLTRALLRKPKVLIMDEATSSVDFETDQKIQETVRREFVDCTVLTIAHRLWTIADYDKILAVDKGTVGEYGTPAELLRDENGHLTSLVNSLGESGAEKFKELVKSKGTD